MEIQQTYIGTGVIILVVLIIIYRLFQFRKQKNYEHTKANQISSKLSGFGQSISEDEPDLRQQELTAMTAATKEQNAFLKQLGNEIKILSDKVDEEVIPDLKEIKKIINSNLSEESWSNFMYQFEKVHPEFFNKLKDQFPSLTPHDLRICACLRVGMERKEIAAISNTTAEAVKKSQYRLKKKMNLGAGEELIDFLMKI